MSASAMEVDPKNSGDVSEILDDMSKLTLDSEVPEITKSLAKLSVEDNEKTDKVVREVEMLDDVVEIVGVKTDKVVKEVEMLDDAVEIVGVIKTDSPHEIALPEILAEIAKAKLPQKNGKVATIKFKCRIEIKYTS